MKYEFRINGTSKLVLTPEDDLEKLILKRIFGSEEVKIENVPNSNDEIIISPTTKHKGGGIRQ